MLFNANVSFLLKWCLD